MFVGIVFPYWVVPKYVVGVGWVDESFIVFVK